MKTKKLPNREVLRKYLREEMGRPDAVVVGRLADPKVQGTTLYLLQDDGERFAMLVSGGEVTEDSLESSVFFRNGGREDPPMTDGEKILALQGALQEMVRVYSCLGHRLGNDCTPAQRSASIKADTILEASRR